MRPVSSNDVLPSFVTESMCCPSFEQSQGRTHILNRDDRCCGRRRVVPKHSFRKARCTPWRTDDVLRTSKIAVLFAVLDRPQAPTFVLFPCFTCVSHFSIFHARCLPRPCVLHLLRAVLLLASRCALWTSCGCWFLVVAQLLAIAFPWLRIWTMERIMASRGPGLPELSDIPIREEERHPGPG